jgi:hypothetical protein
MAFEKCNVQLFSRHDMGILVTDIYDELKVNLVEFLEQFEFYGISTDGWSSEVQKKACISLTIYYLDVIFELQKISMGVISADYRHNADNLSEHIKKICNELKIWKKVSVIVVDHASTMGAMCENLNKDFHGCFNHFLNLICKLFFECIKKRESLVSVSDDEDEDDGGMAANSLDSSDF